MVRLIFNDSFDKIIDEPINYWKTINDIPLIWLIFTRFVMILAPCLYIRNVVEF